MPRPSLRRQDKMPAKAKAFCFQKTLNVLARTQGGHVGENKTGIRGRRVLAMHDRAAHDSMSDLARVNVQVGRDVHSEITECFSALAGGAARAYDNDVRVVGVLPGKPEGQIFGLDRVKRGCIVAGVVA